MAAPRLRLRRGTSNPEDVALFATSPALVGEPFFADTDGSVPTTEGTGTGDFYIADGGSAFVHIGGSSYTARVDSFLVDQIPADNAGVSAGAKIVFEEGGPTGTAETITIQAPVQGAATNSYTMFLPVGAPAAAGSYILEYDQATSQLSFAEQVASSTLVVQQAPEDTDATADVYYPTFVLNNNASPGASENFYTEGQLTFLPDKDGNSGGTISSLKIVGEYVASTGYFSGTGSTDTASVTTNFATEPTASGNTKEVNVGTGSAAGSTTNINIGSDDGTTTINSPIVVGSATTQNLYNTVATTLNFAGAATTIEIGSTANTSVTNINGTTANTLGTLNGALVVDGGASVAGNVTIGADLAVEGGDIVADPNNLGNAVALFDTSTGTANLFGAATTSNIAYDGAASSTTNIADGATASASTNTINIGTNGVTGSTTNVTIGSAFAGTTEFLGTDDNTLGTVTSGAVQMDGGLGVAKNVSIGGSLDVTTNLIVDGTITNGNTADNTLGNLATGAIQLAGGLAVSKNTTIGGDLAVEGGNIVADPDNTGNTAALYDTSTGTVNIGGASATLNLGNDGTGATTVNIATGATATGTTKTVNIATSGAADSTTAVNIGSASEPDQTTVTIFGNLTVQGTQTITNINTTNTNVSDRLLGLATGATSAGATEDSGLIIERGTTGDNVFIGFDEDNDVFVTGLTTETSASTTAGTITPVTFLAKQLNITDAAGTNESVIRYFTAGDANTEFGVSDAVAERYIHNVVIDGGVF